MKNTPQVEDGYTRISNEIIEDWTRINLSPYQWAVLHHIIRYTYGYHVKLNKISINHIVQGTGIQQPNVSRALKELTLMNIVIHKGKLRGYNKDSGSWKTPVRKPTYISRDISQSYSKNPQDQNISVETSNKNISVETSKYISRDIKNISVERPNKDNIKKTYKESKNNKEIKDIFDFYLETSKTKERQLPSRKVKISARLKTFTEEEIKRAITNCFEDSFYTGSNDRSWKADANYIFGKDEVIDRLLNLKPLHPVKTKSLTLKETHEKIMLEASILSDRQIARERGEKV